MFRLWFSISRLLISPGWRRELALENLALPQQLAVMKRQCPRPRLRAADRRFWVSLSQVWPNWRGFGCGETGDRRWLASTKDSGFSGSGFPGGSARVDRERVETSEIWCASWRKPI